MATESIEGEARSDAEEVARNIASGFGRARNSIDRVRRRLEHGITGTKFKSGPSVGEAHLPNKPQRRTEEQLAPEFVGGIRCARRESEEEASSDWRSDERAPPSTKRIRKKKQLVDPMFCRRLKASQTLLIQFISISSAGKPSILNFHSTISKPCFLIHHASVSSKAIFL